MLRAPGLGQGLPHDVARSEGSRRLTLAGSLAKTAKAAGLDVRTVARYRSGERTPTDATRQALEASLGIPPSAWDEPPQDAPAPEASAPEEPDEPIELHESAGRDLAVRHLERVRALRASATSTTERLRLIEAERRAIEMVGRFNRELSTAIDESRILESPKVRAAFTAIVEAIAPWPDAFAAAQAAIEATEL